MFICIHMNVYIHMCVYIYICMCVCVCVCRGRRCRVFAQSKSMESAATASRKVGSSSQWRKGQSIDLLKSHVLLMPESRTELAHLLPRHLRILCRELDRTGQQVVILLYVVCPGLVRDLTEQALTKDGGNHLILGVGL